MVRRSLLAVVAVAVGAVTAGPPATARQARLPIAKAARACHNHAGTAEGDGEYSDGAIQSADGISCAHALALVRPRYRWIYAHWSQAYRHGFRIGSFRCRITPDGPDALKSCVYGRRRFSFF